MKIITADSQQNKECSRYRKRNYIYLRVNVILGLLKGSNNEKKKKFKNNYFEHLLRLA